MEKQRLDLLMVQQGLTPSREQAKTLIMLGEVLIDGRTVDKPGTLVTQDCEIVVKKAVCPYVSRGGLKLAKAVEAGWVSLDGRICADIGASTGGFTDCMLKNGASYVYAVDVGYGQLDWKLRNDPRVGVMERTNARYLKAQDFARCPGFASIDVSFISLKLIFPALREVGVSEIIALIKPQFEAGRDKVGKKGVVRELPTHIEVIENVFKYAQEQGYAPQHLDFSPVKGPNGNIEYLLHLLRDAPVAPIDVAQIARASHEILSAK